MTRAANARADRPTPNDTPAIFAFLNAHLEFNDTISNTIDVQTTSKSYATFLQHALKGRSILVLDLSIYMLAIICLMPSRIQRRIIIVHHNTAYACNDPFLKRHVKAAIFRVTRARHVFLSSRIARFHSLYFGSRSSFLPHPLTVRVHAELQRDPALLDTQRGFISGNLNRKGSPFLRHMVTRFNVASRLPEHRDRARSLGRYNTMAELLQDYDYMISDIDRQYNRVSGIFYDCLGAGLTVYAHALPFLNDVSRYASVERVDFGEYNAKKIRITLEGAGRYNRDFVTSWRHFIYGEAG